MRTTTTTTTATTRVVYCPTCERAVTLLNLPGIENIKLRQEMKTDDRRILPPLKLIFVPFTCSSLLHTGGKVVEPIGEGALTQTEAYKALVRVGGSLGATVELAIMDELAGVFTFPRAFIDTYRHKMKLMAFNVDKEDILDPYVYADFF